MKEELFTTQLEEIRQKSDKSAKIRALIPLYRNGLIYHNKNGSEMEKLETQLMKFPRGRHDDCPDGLQMALYLYELQPQSNKIYKMPEIKFNKFGMPIVVK